MKSKNLLLRAGTALAVGLSFIASGSAIAANANVGFSASPRLPSQCEADSGYQCYLIGNDTGSAKSSAAALAANPNGVTVKLILTGDACPGSWDLPAASSGWLWANSQNCKSTGIKVSATSGYTGPVINPGTVPVNFKPKKGMAGITAIGINVQGTAAPFAIGYTTMNMRP